MIPMKFAEKFILVLEKRDITAAQVARGARIPASRLSEWQDPATKRKPTAAQALRLARFLDLPLEWLLDDDLDPPIPESSAFEQKLLWLARHTGPVRAVRRLMGLPDDGELPEGFAPEGLASPYRADYTPPNSSAPNRPAGGAG